MHTFTAIYSISCLRNLLFSCLPSSSGESGFFCLFFALLRSKQPEVLVFTVHLAVGTFSESLFFLDFLRARFVCPWTNSLVFAGFRSFFRIELFWSKTRFWIFTDFHKF